MKRLEILGLVVLLGITVFVVPACNTTPHSPTAQKTTTPDTAYIALTPTEYNNTVRDLLGMPDDPTAWPDAPPIAAQLLPKRGEKSGVFGIESVEPTVWPWSFPDEMGLDGFEGMADGQASSPYSVEELQKAAAHFASFTLVSPTFFACEDWSNLTEGSQSSCGWSSIERFAQQAWRRPLTNDEKERLQSFWEKALQEGTPDEAVVLTVAGLLQSPAFVFRIEHGDVENTKDDAVPLTGWEMAARLSYFLWDSMPDATLFEAAESGMLSTAEQVEQQARRMLDDPRARPAIVHFHDQWLGTTDIQGISPARRVYGPLYGIAPAPPLDTTGDGAWPSILVPVRHSMRAETHLFIERTVFDGGGTLKALLTDNHGYMSSFTQPLYGENATVLPGPTVQWPYGLVSSSIGGQGQLTLYPTEFPADQRAGVLTLPAVLALGAYSVHPAPVIRGKHILERLACQTCGAPPPEAEAATPPDTEDAEATNRQRTEIATSPDACAGCHNTLNPPGFAFEQYDAMGQWRATDNGFDVDASGSFTLMHGETFDFQDGVDLAHQLAESTQVRQCYILHWARYATGVHLKADHGGIASLHGQFPQSVRVQDLIVAITKSDLFRFRHVGGTP